MGPFMLKSPFLVLARGPALPARGHALALFTLREGPAGARAAHDHVHGSRVEENRSPLQVTYVSS